MKRAKKLYILLGVLALACIATFILTRMEEEKEQIKASGETILSLDPSTVTGIVTVGAGINLYIDGLQVSGYTGVTGELASNMKLAVGTHVVTYEIKAGWDGSSVSLTWNGTTIENKATITVTADMTEFTLSATGAINSTGVSDNTGAAADDGMGLTDYLLIILVVLIVVMAIMVALRLMRS